MGSFSVWAPEAERVELVLDDRTVRMEGRPGGWWCGNGDGGAGTRYAYALDGGNPLPDPRSRFQPLGVDGPSEVVDPSAFSWHDARWRGVQLAGAVLYELHVGTFTPEGTFEAVIARLDHLVELGVHAIEVLPVAEFSGCRGWGYDGVDLFAPHHAYGGPEGLVRLVDACHQAGLGVVMDVVYNHLGPAGNHLARFGPYFTDRTTTYWGDAVNFDGGGSGEVRRFVIDNARMWLRDYHCDGLRLDAVHAISDNSAVHVLEELAVEVEALSSHLGRPLSLIAESDLNDPRLVRSRDAGGYGLDAAWADDWHHALHATLTGERDGYYEDFGPVPLLAKALRQGWVHDGTWSEHRRRFRGRPVTGLSGRQFVVSTQNHDQVGNRALGERLGELTTPGRAKAAAALLLSGPFTPMLFQGEEWAASSPFQYFTDHDDPALAEAVRRGRRQEFEAFGWAPSAVPDPQDPATFARSKLDWGELGRAPHAEMLAWYRLLISLRRRLEAWSDPRLETVSVAAGDDGAPLVVRRGSTMVAANLGVVVVTVDVPESATLLAGSGEGVTLAGGKLRLVPDGVAVLEGAFAA